jgi:GT2 family glycosyltransferase
MHPATSRLAVVIPTRDRASRLARLLTALAAQDIGESFEVIVIDDGSKDDTMARATAMATNAPFHLSILTTTATTTTTAATSPTGPAAARNQGWRATKAEVVAFTDDDCVPDPAWLRTLTEPLLSDGADIAVGRTKPPADQLERIGPFSSYLDIGHDKSFSTCNIAYRREVLEHTDGFDADAFRWPNGEDTDLGLRAVKAGFHDTEVEDALVLHDVGPSDFAVHLSRVPRLEGLVALVARHPEARDNLNAGLFLRSVDKAVLLTWVVALNLILRRRSRPGWLWLLTASVLYVWQFTKSHYPPRTPGEWAVSVPLAFVADTFATAVMIRSSLEYRTILL